MKKSVGELLNFDDALYRSFRRGAQAFDVYVAYWRPGKMSSRLVAAHTPDVCWVGSGWSLVEHDARAMPSLKNTPLATAQHRIFEFEGTRQNVLFWHLSGGRLISYDKVATPPWWAPIHDLLNDGLNQRQEQYFLRISSTLPTDEWERDPDVQKLLQSLANLPRKSE